KEQFLLVKTQYRVSTHVGQPETTEAGSPAPNHFFFEFLVVVSLQQKTKDSPYEPLVIYKFPKEIGLSPPQREEEEKSLQAITLFCFPEGVNWIPLTQYQSETFSFVLTETDGTRRNGFCRRLLPHGRGKRPPEAYCIVSQVACFGLFSKIFDEVEKRREKSMAMIYPFMQSLREAPFPEPGETVQIKSFIPESGTEIITLTRPLESRLEHVDFQILFCYLSNQEILQVFASTLMERRIVFIAEELGTLSQVLHAVAALLSPFAWQHTFISTVPTVLMEVLMAPTPYLLGVHKNTMDGVFDKDDVDDVTPEEINTLVSEAFVSFFIKTVGHYSAHVKRSKSQQPGIFQRKTFCKSIENKSHQQFVTNFIETQMFDVFIQDVERRPASNDGFFSRKIAEYEETKKETDRMRWRRRFLV
uniref:DENN/MADD domain containing 2Db n=1 Tax=Gadus morhua TaxID=8049 RepID=A0A8C5BK34_GADMO